MAVQRAFRSKGVPPNREAEARPEFVEILIDTALVDQYLAQLKVEPDKKDIDAKVEAIYAEITQRFGARKLAELQDMLGQLELCLASTGASDGVTDET